MPSLKYLFALGACFTLTSQAQFTPRPTAAFVHSAKLEPGQSPQLIPRSHEERERRFQIQHHIILNVHVTNSSGKPVRGLKEKKFTLLQDRRPIAFASFRAVEGPTASAPTHVILLLDAVNNSSRSFSSDRREIEKYLKHAPSQLNYPTSIAVSSEAGLRVGQSTLDRNILLLELNNLTSHLHAIGCADEVSPNESFMAVWMPGNATSPQSARQLACLNQRFTLSVAALETIANQQANIPGKAILIWIGPGWPLLYNKQFSPDDDVVRRDLFENLVRVSTALREAQVTLNMISPADHFRKTPSLNEHDNAFLNGVPNPNEVTSASLSLQAFAHQSGGQLLIDSKDIPGGIAACIADAEAFYILSFDSAPAKEPDEFHSLEVRVDDPGLKVRTNTVYYAAQ